MNGSEGPEITVIIPTHQGRHRETHRALQSALAQAGVSLEVIIVDDGSSPSFALDEEFSDDPRVRIIARLRNGGAAAARNDGVRYARGNWIAFLDSDDVWRQGKLLLQLALATRRNSDGGLFVVAGGFRLVDERRQHVRTLIPSAASDVSSFASGCWFCPGSTAFLPRTAFDIVGLFDEGLRRLEDFDWYLRFAVQGGELLVVPDVLADVNVGARPSVAAVREAVEFMVRKYPETGHLLSGSERRRFRAYMALEEAAALWNAGSRLSALPSLARSWILAPRRRLHLVDFWQSAAAIPSVSAR
ncbi:glycosyltransferase family 2 protein [Parvibaculum sp.]|uniref:glycosyltransferase family 2 protein n=1 Tax=Parvibaculum sp. TaxID=2024848 RepID=UPI0025FCECC1|nr:glycosyltransferase family 2 protein [Parvibaculum sp.]